VKRIAETAILPSSKINSTIYKFKFTYTRQAHQKILIFKYSIFEFLSFVFRVVVRSFTEYLKKKHTEGGNRIAKRDGLKRYWIFF
jgi:hypothetical protein